MTARGHSREEKLVFIINIQGVGASVCQFIQEAKNIFLSNKPIIYKQKACKSVVIHRCSINEKQSSS